MQFLSMPFAILGIILIIAPELLVKSSSNKENGKQMSTVTGIFLRLLGVILLIIGYFILSAVSKT